MNYKKQIGNNLIALVLFVALMMPSAIQFFHTLEGHEHLTCTEKATHIHKSVTKCEICSFLFTSLNYDIAKHPDLLFPIIFVKVNETFTVLQLHSSKIAHKQLRAPPFLS